MIDTPEKFAIHILGKEKYDHSPCQAHPYELIATEVERLREAIPKFHFTMPETQAVRLLQVLIDEKDAEIERLREDAESGNDWERQLLGCDKELTEAHAEIERLKDAIWKALAQQGYWGTRTEEICSDLRAALAKKEGNHE